MANTYLECNFRDGRKLEKPQFLSLIAIMFDLVQRDIIVSGIELYDRGFCCRLNPNMPEPTESYLNETQQKLQNYLKTTINKTEI